MPQIACVKIPTRRYSTADGCHALYRRWIAPLAGHRECLQDEIRSSLCELSNHRRKRNHSRYGGSRNSDDRIYLALGHRLGDRLMSRKIQLQVLRGAQANIPSLALGEMYFSTDTSNLFFGTPGVGLGYIQIGDTTAVN